MAHVRIPNEHFTKSARRAYSDPDTALIREFLQNSVDAGAKNIDFVILADGEITVTDNGCGMNENVLINGLLTLSGTVKGPNSVGMFGSAKELLIFSARDYEILTQDLKVNGSVLEYEMVKNSWRDGTKITIHAQPDYFDYALMFEKAKAYLESCDINAKVTLNGNKITTYTKLGDRIREFPYANVYCRKSRTQHQYMLVRINGVTMFQKYIGPTTNEIIMEITKPSVEILATNRDGFQWAIDGDIGRLLAEIIIDKRSINKLKDTRTKIVGRTPFEKILKELYDQHGIYIDKCELETRYKDQLNHSFQKGVFGDEKNVVAARSALAELIPANKQGVLDEIQIDSVDYSTNVDFYIDIHKSGFNTIPEWLHPSTMGKRKYTIAKLWKKCLKIVMEANDVESNFVIGWIIDDERAAQHSVIDGVDIFQFNPTSPWLDSSNHHNVFHKMLMVACHEVAHKRYRHHDEDFMVYYDHLLHKTLCSMKSWWKDYVESKQEVV